MLPSLEKEGTLKQLNQRIINRTEVSGLNLSIEKCTTSVVINAVIILFFCNIL